MANGLPVWDAGLKECKRHNNSNATVIFPIKPFFLLPSSCRCFANTSFSILLVAQASLMMSPRPILKHSEPSNQQPTPTAPRYPRGSLPHKTPSPHGVHFPPSPTLTRTFSAYSPSTYDRSPIVVSPNSCALPERGCPGRTYTLDEPAARSSHSRWKSTTHNGRHLHPRAVASAYRESSMDSDDAGDEEHTPTSTYPTLPSLVPDLSSESDESDGFASPPSEYAFYPTGASYYPPHQTNHIAAQSHPPIPYAQHHNISYSNDESYFAVPPTALSFLPHPVSPPDGGQKARRRRQRSRDQSRTRDERQASSDPRRGTDGSYKSLSVCRALANCSLEGPDDGCLGGF